MKHTTIVAAKAVLVLALSATPFTPGRAQCGGDATATLSDVEVYASPPMFRTGSGWVLATKVATLPRGSCVRVLERKTVGFGGSSRAWARIQFQAPGAAGNGWIPVDGALTAATTAPPLRVVPVALADSGTTMDLGVPSDLVVLLWVFAAMVLGMAAKGVVDHLGQGTFIKGYLRDTLRALVVSPLVFAGLAKAGDFQFQDTTAFVVFLCMSFQNGFFWQTMLVRAPPSGAGAPASTAPRASVA